MCSRHFIERDFKETGGRRFLNSSAIPSIFPWSNEEETHCPKKRQLPNVREFLSAPTSSRTSDEENVMSSDSEDESGPTTSTAMEVDETFTASQKEIANHRNEVASVREKLQAETEKLTLLESKLVEANNAVEDLTKQCQGGQENLFSYERFKTDKDVNFYTGFPTVEIFEAFYDCCDPGEVGQNLLYWHSGDTSATALEEEESSEVPLPKRGRPRSLSPKEELFITLPIKTGISRRTSCSFVWCVTIYNQQNYNKLDKILILKAERCTLVAIKRNNQQTHA